MNEFIIIFGSGTKFGFFKISERASSLEFIITKSNKFLFSKVISFISLPIALINSVTISFLSSANASLNAALICDLVPLNDGCDVIDLTFSISFE